MKNRESSLTTPVDRTVDERDKVDVADVKVILTRRQGSANQQFRHPPESLELRSKLRDGTRRDLHPRTLDSAQLQLPSSGRHPGSETGAHAARAKARRCCYRQCSRSAARSADAVLHYWAGRMAGRRQ